MAETFGKTTKGVTKATASANYIRGFKATSGSAGTLASISLYIEYIENTNVKCAICDASFNLLSNGTTEQKAITSGQDDWMIFNFGTPPTVAAATIYWLLWWPSNTFSFYYTAGAAGMYTYDSQTYNGWPDPIVPGGYAARDSSIYATYTEAPPGAKTLVQAALISIPPLIVLPTLSQILKITGGC